MRGGGVGRNRLGGGGVPGKGDGDGGGDSSEVARWRGGGGEGWGSARRWGGAQPFSSASENSTDVLIIRQEQHMKEYCGDAAKNVARHDEVCGGGGNRFTPASTTPATTAVVAQRGGAEGKTGREWVNLSMNL